MLTIEKVHGEQPVNGRLSNGDYVGDLPYDVLCIIAHAPNWATSDIHRGMREGHVDQTGRRHYCSDRPINGTRCIHVTPVGEPLRDDLLGLEYEGIIIIDGEPIRVHVKDSKGNGLSWIAPL